MEYYSTHSISQFLLNNEKQRVRFLLAHPVRSARYFDTKFSLFIQYISLQKYV